MGFLSFIDITLGVILLLLIISYFVKPELLVLPYSLAIGPFVRNPHTEERRVVLFLDMARGATLPSWLQGINAHMIHLLAESKRIKDGVNRAKVPART